MAVSDGRIIAVGDGKGRFGHCLTADSGNTVGEITGHSSEINCVALRQQRPLRAATGSNDNTVVFFHGVPFKFNTSLRGQHSRFIYGIAFSPDGETLVSVGMDRKIWLYDGKTGEVKHQIGDGEHHGSIFGVSWAKDSKRFVTCSGDQTVKIWDVEAGKSVQTWRMGEENVVSVPDHQVGVVWPSGRSDGLILSLNLTGDLNYLIEGSPKPQRVVQGHQKNITAIGASLSPSKEKTLWTGSSEGRLYSWDTGKGSATAVDGATHTNYISGISDAPGEHLYSVGWDDTLRSIDVKAKTFVGGSVKTDGQPRGVATSGEQVIVATHRDLELFWQGKKITEAKANFTPSAIGASGKTVAVGGDDNALHIYALGWDSLSPEKTIAETSSLITALAFSPTKPLLAVGFANGKISVYDTEKWTPSITRWSAHTGRITSIAWNTAGTHAASGALDSSLYVWSVAKPGTRVHAANAHKDGVNGVEWIDHDQKIATVGGDAAVKIWKVEGLS